MECETATLHGTLAEWTAALTVTPHYTGCETSLETEATIDMNGCDYRLRSGEEVEGSKGDAFGGSLDVLCPEGKEIKVTAGFCNIDIAAQENIGGITFTNQTEASPEDVTVDVEATLAVKGTNVFLCPEAVTKATTGTLESTITLKGYEDLEGGKEGSQVGILVISV